MPQESELDRLTRLLKAREDVPGYRESCDDIRARIAAIQNAAGADQGEQQ